MKTEKCSHKAKDVRSGKQQWNGHIVGSDPSDFISKEKTIAGLETLSLICNTEVRVCMLNKGSAIYRVTSLS